MGSKNIGAIILAAGQSSRMGRIKALLTLKNETFIEREVSIFRDFGIKNIVVVTGYNAKEINNILSQLNVVEAYNPDPSRGMFSSVCIGAKYIAQLCDAFFILPVDIPLIRPCTLDIVYKNWLKDTTRIIIPSFEGVSGHPPLFPSYLTVNLINWSGEKGLHGFLKSFKNLVSNVFTPNEHMLLDIDTPKDYLNLETYIKYFDVPTPKECLALLDNYSVSSNVKDHSIAVALIAKTIAQKLNEKGLNINLEIVEAAGLLHDIARTEKNHSKKGAEILQDFGFFNVADAVRNHMDMCVKDDDQITAAEIVFIADKYTLGNKFVELEERYGLKMKEYKYDVVAKKNIENKLMCALKSKARIEKLLGVSISSLINGGIIC